MWKKIKTGNNWAYAFHLAILLKVKQQKGQLLEMKHENQYFLFNIGWFLQSATVAEHSPTCISRSHHITLAIAHVYVSGYTSKKVLEIYFLKDIFNEWTNEWKECHA